MNPAHARQARYSGSAIGVEHQPLLAGAVPHQDRVGCSIVNRIPNRGFGAGADSIVTAATNNNSGSFFTIGPITDCFGRIAIATSAEPAMASPQIQG